MEHMSRNRQRDYSEAGGKCYDAGPMFALHTPRLLHAIWRIVFPTTMGLLLCAPGAGAYQEAPILAERVAKGELPPVAERLPENPLIVEPVHSIGRYGGTWRRVAMGARDFSLTSRLGYEPLVRWDRTGKKVVPALAERWEVSGQGRTYLFHLRKGVRWSDGAPFTSEDLMFWYEDVLLNKDLTPIFPAWLVVEGKPVVISAPDAYTVEFKFAKPYGIFLEFVAFCGNQMFYPKHYVRQFHEKYVPAEELEAKAQERGITLWHQFFTLKADVQANTELPVLKPFQLATDPTSMRVLAKRNPYYWKVDPEGNQLPYIDEIAYAQVQNGEITNMKAMTGDVDFQARRIDTSNFPLFMANRKQYDYRVLRDFDSGCSVLYLNQCSKDPELKPILQDRRFRIALSVAVNRAELIDLIYSGMAEPARGVASRWDPYWLPEFSEKYLEYDPEKAKRLLDEVGITADAHGRRHLPSGRPFRQILNVYPSETGTGADMWQLIADYFREIGLEFTVKVDAPTLSVMQVANGNSDFWAYGTAGMHWIVDPVWYVPWQHTSYFAPLYGRYHMTRGKNGEKPPQEYQQLLDWYYELRSNVDEDRKLEYGRKILRQWSEECYTIGICRPEALTIVANRFKNVPEHIIHSYRLMTPGYIGIEQFYIDEGDPE